MMENIQKTITLPNIEKARQDLIENENVYKASAEKLRRISKDVETRKVEKRAMQAEIDEQKRIIKYYSDLYVETTSKIQNILIRQNKAKLLEASNEEKMKRIKADKINFNTFDFENYQSAGSNTAEHLQLQKEDSEQTLSINNEHMKELLNRINL